MLSEQLKIIRKANGFTQVELAKVIGIERSTYASYETGRNRPDVSVLDKIAKAFGVTVDYILSIKGGSVQLSDVSRNYNGDSNPHLLSELSVEERMLVSKLRTEPEKLEEIRSILFSDEDVDILKKQG